MDESNHGGLRGASGHIVQEDAAPAGSMGPCNTPVYTVRLEMAASFSWQK